MLRLSASSAAAAGTAVLPRPRLRLLPPLRVLLATLSSMAGRNCAPPPPPDVPTCEAVVGLSESSCDRSEYTALWESLSLESAAAGLANACCC